MLRCLAMVHGVSGDSDGDGGFCNRACDGDDGKEHSVGDGEESLC